MSDRIRISRRRVMQMGIAAPLIAMEARGASAQEIEAKAKRLAKVPFPEDKLKDLKGRAKAFCDDNQCDGFDETDFGLIALLLWDQFCGGVESGGAKVPETGQKLSDLLEAAYNATSRTTGRKTSGQLIAMRTKYWGDKFQNVTNYCAFRCGIHAASKAGTGLKVDGKDYQAAFEQTSDEMQELVLRIKPPPDDPARIRGGGC